MNTITNHIHELAQRIAALSPVDQIALFAAVLFVVPGLISMALTSAQLGYDRIRRLVRRKWKARGRRLAYDGAVPIPELLSLAQKIEANAGHDVRDVDPYEAARIFLGLPPRFDQATFLLGVTDLMARLRTDPEMSDPARALMLLTLIDAVLVIDHARDWGRTGRALAQMGVSNP